MYLLKFDMFANIPFGTFPEFIITMASNWCKKKPNVFHNINCDITSLNVLDKHMNALYNHRCHDVMQYIWTELWNVTNRNDIFLSYGSLMNSKIDGSSSMTASCHGNAFRITLITGPLWEESTSHLIPSQRASDGGFDISFHVGLNKLLTKAK